MLVYCAAGASRHDRSQSPDDYWLDPASHERRAVQSATGRRCFGEALPYAYVDFGASTLCGMQGCPVRYTGYETIWTDPCYDSLEATLAAGTCETQPFSRCVRESFARAAGRLRGKALVAPYCIGAPADNLAGLIGTEPFLYALYDEPELLERSLKRQLDVWLHEWDGLMSALRPSHDRPMTGWHGIWAPGSTFPIQEDIGYMLGCDHYQRFCLPGIFKMVDSLDYPFFHLDGRGALKHLDALLDIPRLGVIQWQPGDGAMQVDLWYDVVKKIVDAGRGCQLYVQPDEIEPLIRNVGARGLLLIVNTDEERALELARRYRLEENSITEESLS